jgi:hypothetical protein
MEACAAHPGLKDAAERMFGLLVASIGDAQPSGRRSAGQR